MICYFGFLRPAVLAIAIISFIAAPELRAQASEFSLDKWKQLRPGMTEADVVRTLGQPDDQFREGWRVLVYGIIVPKGEVFPRPLGYWVWLDNKNIARSFGTPFGGEAPRSGSPAVPKIFLPANNTQFSHYPRILDIRWHPVTGTYPVSYELEYEAGSKEANGMQWYRKVSFSTPTPHLSIQHVGAQPGRIRVRSKNTVGVSSWSEFAVFEFSQ
ncbi:MAG: hypothetical protein FJX42_03015 [Alphaproteobacteria bacterium]|nr:hypothetical protein [Alphaproteobacteria bacterium]